MIMLGRITYSKGDQGALKWITPIKKMRKDKEGSAKSTAENKESKIFYEFYPNQIWN